MFISIQAVLCSQLQFLNNEMWRSILSVLAAVARVPLSVMTPLCWYVSAHHVQHQVAPLHGADSLIFKEMCCTVVVADSATTDQSVTANTVAAAMAVDATQVIVALWPFDQD